MYRFPLTIANQLTSPASKSALCFLLGAACLGTFTFLNSVQSSLQSDEKRIIPSPGNSILSSLSQEEIDSLPYPPNALPGARDVESPYGTFRVYEWGPEGGPRVLLIHGISTPSVALGPLASKLVEKGCRVMLFDLFGRGHSSAPSPSLHQYSSALYTTQILLTLHSSPLRTWKPFTLIGYSLGGALAADFTSYFPSSISHLFLLAPGGLIRTSHITWKSRLLYSTGGIVPEWLIERLVAQRLWTGPETARTIEPEPDPEPVVIDGREAKEEEEEKGGLRGSAVYTSSHHQLLPGNPNSTVGKVVDWQIQHHAGFVPAFISSIRYAHIHGQQHRWRLIGEYMKESAVSGGSGEGAGLKEVHLILGETDPIIVADEIVEDAKEVLGQEYLRLTVMKGVGHEVAIEKAEEIADLVSGVLGL